MIAIDIVQKIEAYGTQHSEKFPWMVKHNGKSGLLLLPLH
jgi:hypothetical protein